jgi:hypothetical protein
MIVKRPIADLHLHFPYAPFDCRLTLSCENPIKIPSTMPQLLFTREKDRISYRSADGFCIDLTQVRKRNQITHELELEMTDVERVLAEKSRLASGLPNEFSGIIGKLVANIRAIVVKSSVITAAAAAAAATSSSSSYSNSVGANHARPNTSGNNGNGNDGDDDNRSVKRQRSGGSHGDS